MATRRLLLSVLTIMLPLMASADIVFINDGGICYNLNNTYLTASVTHYYDPEADPIHPENHYNYSGAKVIPSIVQYNGKEYSVTSIDDGAFYGCRGLTSVTIPSSVTSIDTNAFSGCSGLTSVSIPNSVTAIGDGAFSGCRGLTSVTISNSVTAIGKGTFSDSGLTSVTIPNSVKSIGDYAFSGCNGLTSVTIPNSVTLIGKKVFEGCSGLTSVTIPNSMTAIGNYAFYSCTGLTSVTIPSSVTSIGNYAFYGCTGLTSVTIPSSVTSIGESAFSGCTGLTSVTIPSSVTFICNNAFYNCSSLTSVTIPNSVTSIGSYAFYGCTGLTSVTIPNSVTFIGSYTFYGCSSLTSVSISNSVTSIGESAFRGCSGLTSVTIPNSVTSIGNYAFYNCNGLTSVTIPNSVTSIGNYAFYGCNGLTSVTIPNSVTAIGKFAFYECSSLTSVSIPNSVTAIGESAFQKCSGLTSVSISNSVTSIGESAFRGCSGLTSVTIPNSVTSIGNYAFYGCNGLTSVTIPNSVTSISKTAFGGGNNLNVRIPVSDMSVFCKNTIVGLVMTNIGKPVLLIDSNGLEIKDYVIPNSVTSIGNYAFSGCTGLTSVTIPNSVTSIGNYTFSGCTGLTSVTIPNSVTSIGNYAFRNCSGLTSVNIGNSVTSIGNYAFYGCSGLTSVTIPNSVTSIGVSAFNGCSSLTSVTIPNSVKSIGESAFEDCSSLTSVTVNWLRPVDISTNTFSNMENATLYVPVPCWPVYMATNWGYFKEVVEISDTTYTLTYKVDDEVYKTYELQEGAVITPEAEPIMDGYTFSGWSEIPATMPAEDVFVFGYFEKIGDISETTYTLTYMVDDEVYKTYEMQEGDVITPETEPIMEGYIFSGWSEIPGTMPSHDVTVYGYFEFDTNTTDAILCDNLQCISGSKPILKVGLTNTNEVKLCQFDLQLPAGVTVSTKSNGKLEAKLTERAETHSVSSKQLENGNYRFVISSLDNDSFIGNSGTLIEITLDIPLNIEAGEYIVKVINAELSVPDGNDLKVVKPADTESKLTVSNYTPGDVNNDGSVSVTDVGCAINYILEQIPSVFVFEAADMNGDNTVSVTDVGMIINLILSDGASSRRRAPERNNSDNGLLPQINLQPTAEGYELRLEDKDAYIGFQFDMELSDDAVISGIQLNGPANDDHLLTYRRLSNGKWRVVCYSPTNSSFYNDDSALLTISASNSISVSDIRLTTFGLNELHPSNLFGMPTGIANVEKTNSKTTLNLYSLSGNIYRILNLRSGVNSFDGLRPGIYLIDNKKIIIR